MADILLVSQDGLCFMELGVFEGGLEFHQINSSMIGAIPGFCLRIFIVFPNIVGRET
jgi:hypothetical protein